MSITPIPDLYHVKWYERGTGRWRFGVVDRFSEASIAYYNEERTVIVFDAIMPERYVLNIDCLSDIPSSFQPQDEYYNYLDAQYQLAKTASDQLPAGLHKGKLFRTPVGDGHAYYVVTKVNKKTVDIEWRGFSGDRYVDMHFGGGGRYPRDMIEPFVHREDAYRRIFAAPREEAQNA